MTTAARTWPAWSTTVHVAVSDPAALETACAAVRDEMSRTSRAADRFDPASELSAVNAARGRPVAVSPAFARLLRLALDAAEATGGLVDPTLGAQLHAAGYDRDIAAVRRQPGPAGPVRPNLVAWRQVVLTDESVRLPDGALLDLGATAKARTADLAAAQAARRTGADVLVSLGGDVAVSGGSWRVQVGEHPEGDDGPYVELATGGLATSTTVARTWTVDGRTAHHLIDPRTGEPARGPWRTATVAAASALDANVASTAAVVLGDDAEAWLAGHGLPTRLVAHDGTVRTVAGWPTEAAA
jgi:thiamine biosynthesis lipoprotein